MINYKNPVIILTAVIVLLFLIWMTKRGCNRVPEPTIIKPDTILVEHINNDVTRRIDSLTKQVLLYRDLAQKEKIKAREALERQKKLIEKVFIRDTLYQADSTLVQLRKEAQETANSYEAALNYALTALEASENRVDTLQKQRKGDSTAMVYAVKKIIALETDNFELKRKLAIQKAKNIAIGPNISASLGVGGTIQPTVGVGVTFTIFKFKL